jgi:hypothetical protein
MGWMMAANAGLSLLGGMSQSRALGEGVKDVKELAQFDPQNMYGNFGSVVNQNGQTSFNEDPQTAMMRQIMASQGGNLLQGGMFNNQNLQTTMSGVDFGGAYGNAQNQMSQQFNASPFDPTQQAQGMFQQGQQNLANAGNQQGMMQQYLDAANQMAAPGEQRMMRDFRENEFMGSRGATSGAWERQGMLGDTLTSANNQRVQAAMNMGQQQQQFMSGLGAQQMGMGFQGMGQGFNQSLQGLQQNQTSGQNRLQNALGMFNFGSGLQGQQVGLGMNMQAGLAGMNQAQLNAILGQYGAENNRIQATGYHAQALGDLAGSAATSSGGMFGGIAGAFGL